MGKGREEGAALGKERRAGRAGRAGVGRVWVGCGRPPAAGRS